MSPAEFLELGIPNLVVVDRLLLGYRQRDDVHQCFAAVWLCLHDDLGRRDEAFVLAGNIKVAAHGVPFVPVVDSGTGVHPPCGW